ncbi:MAG: domain S-box-containing protein, partial [Conexibacter sp.]|nr:domain S-box-containing protein [Conexibacter sp.]
MIAGEPMEARPGVGRPVDLVAEQACGLAGVRGALVVGADARVLAAAGDGAEYRGAVVAAEQLDDLGVTAQIAVREPDGTELGAIAVIADDDAPSLDDALRGLATLAGLSWRASERADAVDRVFAAGVDALGRLLSLRDGYTGDHGEEVVALCERIARHMELPPATMRELDMAARLHDLGKIGVPDVILHKPGKLTPSEWEVMRKHPAWGAEALASVPGGAGLAAAVRGHHERWDGRGYPDELSGEEIPIASRVIAVADAWHAMTSNRSYRRALDDEHARQELCDGVGTQFDPEVVDALLAVTAA